MRVRRSRRGRCPVCDQRPTAEADYDKLRVEYERLWRETEQTLERHALLLDARGLPR